MIVPDDGAPRACWLCYCDGFSEPNTERVEAEDDDAWLTDVTILTSSGFVQELAIHSA